jgi:hypothetical protein
VFVQKNIRKVRRTLKGTVPELRAELCEAVDSGLSPPTGIVPILLELSAEREIISGRYCRLWKTEPLLLFWSIGITISIAA